jgi:general secretion pathway protein G
MTLLTRIKTLLAARHAQRNRRRHQAGYTLTEILIVLAIISMMMGAAGFIGFDQLNKAKVKQTRNLMVQLKQNYVQWQTTPGNDGCPPSLSALMEKNKEPKDAYGKPFLMKCPSDHEDDLDIISSGKDGKEGTPDDLHSWDEPERKKAP